MAAFFDASRMRHWLHAFEFGQLFIDGLGWDNPAFSPQLIRVDGHDYTLSPVAEKAGFAIFECGPCDAGQIPKYPLRRKIESAIAKRVFEHMIIFVNAARTQQVWQWVKREAGESARYREFAFEAGQTGEALIQRLRGTVFTLGEQAEGIDILGVASRVRATFDVEKVTKRFYQCFKQQLIEFGGFVEGIAEQADRDWYASLMLNRMMFV